MRTESVSDGLNIPSGEILGHPKGLFLLFATEMWERFSYYGMRALLVLSMVAATNSADPGFGWDRSAGGSKAVLEVRSHVVPFMLEHRQIVGWLRYDNMAARPDHVYGTGIGSSYQSQGLALARQFKPYLLARSQ